MQEMWEMIGQTGPGERVPEALLNGARLACRLPLQSLIAKSPQTTRGRVFGAVLKGARLLARRNRLYQTRKALNYL